ncbi:MFS transporter [Gammaproteobacteria bacterium]|nr:MFS transporter [Gammaproteobacteria bacterium]
MFVQLSSRCFYGWLIVSAVFLLVGTAAGTIYAFSVFFEDISQKFNASRSQTSLIFSSAEFVWFLSGFLGGFLSDRFGPARIVLCGAVLMACGFLLASQSRTITEIVLAYSIGVGIGGGFIYIPAISLVPRWFKRKRGLATGIALCGVGLGTFSFPLLGETLLEPLGWEGVHIIFAAILLCVCGGLSFILVGHPQEIGQGPDGDVLKSSADISIPGLGLAEVLRTPVFWSLYLASLLTAAVVFTSYVHLVPFAIDSGNDRVASVGLIGTIGISSIVGRFLFGGVSDRIGSRHTISLMSAGMTAAVIWWFLLPATLVNLYIYAMVFGAFYGGYISLLPVLAMTFFGGRQLSTIVGALYTSWGVGALIGPTMVGYLFDLNNTYSEGLQVLIAFLIVSTFIYAYIRDPSSPF